jgi:hypothetical protein
LHYEEGYGWKDDCKDDCVDDSQALQMDGGFTRNFSTRALGTEINFYQENEVPRKDSARLSISPSRSS